MKLVSALVCVASLVGLPVTRAADIRQGLVAYWQLDSTDGFITPDATPYGNHMSVVNMGPGNFVPGQFGNAAQLASSGYMTNLHSTNPSATGLPIYRNGRYTICMWVKGPAQQNKYLYSEGNTASTGPLLILQTGNAAGNFAKFDVIIRPDTGAALVDHRVSTAVVFDDTWHHIAWVDDNGNVKLYVDGVLDSANFNYAPSGTFTLTSSSIGSLVRTSVSTGNIFNGLIDDVALWRRALSQAEILEVKNSSIMTPVPPFPATILAQPVGSTNRVGDRVTFTATADGGFPLSFQWYKDGSVIDGATGSSLTLSNLTTADSADYTLRVTNQFGTNISSAATLLVLPDPAPDLRAGIVSYWSMDDEPDDPDTGNGALFDVYGSNTFRVMGEGGFIDLFPGVSTNAAAFNGISQFAFRGRGFPIYINPAYSIAFWINANGTNQFGARIFAESSTNNGLSEFSFGSDPSGTNGLLRLFIRNDRGVVLLDKRTSRTVLDGNWHQIVWTETNGEVRLYIDGSLEDAPFKYPRGGVTVDQTAIAALLRSFGGTNFLNGSIDEVAVWSRPISLGEVQQLQTTTVPGPLADLPPKITANPANQSVLTRSTVTFNFAASGTGPFFMQWRRQGTNLPAETNATLIIPSVTLADAANYDVVISNAVGGATSAVAVLSVTVRPATPELKIDFNNPGVADDVPATTEPGFSSFALDATSTPGPVTRFYGGAEVTVAAVGGINLQSRRRATPTNNASFTEEKLLSDFVFASDGSPGQGLDVVLDFLDPDTTYAVTLWSYDNVSAGNRIADWLVNGVLVREGYTFNGTTLPTDNSTYQFTFPARTDGHGTIVISGRRSATATVAFNVFLNALRAVHSEIRVTRIETVAPSSVRLTIEGINPAATHGIEQTTSFENPMWSPVPDAAFDAPVGNTVQVTFGAPDTQTRFYRVVETP